jgi:hypothetical protein
MEKEKAQETLRQLRSRTDDILKFHNIKKEDFKNHSGKFKEGLPIGHIIHCTASDMAISKAHPFGRWPFLLGYLGAGSREKKGVQFIIWDYKFEQYQKINEKYPLLEDMPSDIAFFGDDFSFWHAGWVNTWAYGCEVRNCGPLRSTPGGAYLWAGTNRYRGRQPLRIGHSWWEPYTRQQIGAVVWLGRLMAAVHPIRMEWTLGHCHVSSSRDFDPGKAFPLQEVRSYILDPNFRDKEISSIELLKDYPIGRYENLGDIELIKDNELLIRKNT